MTGLRSTLGIMQGRLSPPSQLRLQAFPWDCWQQEFVHAGALGLDCIEWLFEVDRFEENPIWNAAGIAEINSLQRANHIAVHSVCADYFLACPFFRRSVAEREQSTRVLKHLIEQSAQVGVQVILLPVLEEAEIRTRDEADQLLDALQACLPVAEHHGIRLGLEMELPGEEYVQVIDRYATPWVCAYYDTGNNAARGYNIGLDLCTLGARVGGVHLKDRRLRGGTVPLGTGDTDLVAALAALREVRYEGPLIMQPFFGPDYLGDARRNLQYVRRILEGG